MKPMTPVCRCVGLALALAIVAAPTADAAKDRTYILNGYSFGGMPAGIDTTELSAKLKDQAGARVTQADISVDQAMLEKELEDRHIVGHLFATTAERDGRVWIIFDLQKPRGSEARFAASQQHLKAQVFQGASRVSPRDLAAATGLKVGDTLSVDKINAARGAILALYARLNPAVTPTLKGRMQSTATGEVVLTWIIGEP